MPKSPCCNEDMEEVGRFEPKVYKCLKCKQEFDEEDLEECSDEEF